MRLFRRDANVRARPLALRLLIAGLPVCLCLPSVAHGATPEETGLQIARDARERDDGFGNFTASQAMVLRNKQGKESRRQLRVKVLEVADDGNKTLFVFDEPRDVKGTAFLIHAHKQEADDHVALPAGAQAGEAHQFVQPLGLLHGQRVLL